MGSQSVFLSLSEVSLGSIEDLGIFRDLPSPRLGSGGLPRFQYLVPI